MSIEKIDSIEVRNYPSAAIRERFRGCFLGGAVGDALGAPVEFMSRSAIVTRFGEEGIRDLVPAYGRLGAITDDTQMALFTAEGLLRSYVRSTLRGICHPPSVITSAYLRWLHTQGFDSHTKLTNGWLITHPELFARRAPGNTCLSALQAIKTLGELAHNDSKGCGGVMRVAPVGMMLAGLTLSDPDSHVENLQQSFELGCSAASITHGHPTGQLSSGAFSAIIFQLLEGKPLQESINEVLNILESHPDNAETSTAIRQAVQLAFEKPHSFAAISLLGEGWIAEEALAIGLYSALCAKDFESGVIMAVNHSGDSDSTGLIAGHLLGIVHGVSNIPDRWLRPLELRSVLEEMSDDLATCGYWKLDEQGAEEEANYYIKRFPGN